MGHAEIILKMVELALAHAGEIIDLVKEGSDDVKQIAERVKALHDEVKAHNENQH
jgi:hypothetical protein